MRYLEALEEAKIARKELNYKDETQKAIDAKEKLDKARQDKPTEQNLLRRERAIKAYRGRLDRAAKKMEDLKDHMSYQQIGDILAEAMFGKTRTKVADKLDSFARKQYRRGEVDDASGKPKRAGIRGKVAHIAGKVAQKVRPADEEKKS